MACKKYTLTNNTNQGLTFSYQECSNNMWEYDILLTPGQVRNIWLVNGTFQAALEAQFTIIEEVFPPLSPTPSQTPTNTPTNTPTPSVTGTLTPTPTPSVTGTLTPTPTPSVTGTLTPTPTPTQVVFEYSDFGIDDTLAVNACGNYPQGNAPRYGTKLFDNLIGGDVVYLDFALTTPTEASFYSNGHNYIQTDASGIIIDKGSC
jgi:hypothetical protein